MTQYQQYPDNYGQPPAMTPPVYASEIPQQPSQWPTVIGVISMVFGTLGVLNYGCCNALGSLLSPLMAGPMQNDPMMQAQMQVAADYMAWNILVNLIAASLSGLLLASGIGVLRRRRWGVKASFAWAIARLIYAVPQAFFTYHLMNVQVEALKQAGAASGDPMPPGLAAFLGSFGVLVIILTLVWAALWPMFLLIWFSRGRIRSEVAGWT